jgi:hypothetical protein
VTRREPTGEAVNHPERKGKMAGAVNFLTRAYQEECHGKDARSLRKAVLSAQLFDDVVAQLGFNTGMPFITLGYAKCTKGVATHPLYSIMWEWDEPDIIEDVIFD